VEWRTGADSELDERTDRAWLICAGQGLPMEEWYVNGTYAGTWQTGRNLTYVRVSSAKVK
jgi:hypothetical protein